MVRVGPKFAASVQPALFLSYKNMVKSIPSKKQRGRPSIGVEVSVTARMPPELVEKLEAWAEEHGVTKSKAMRMILAQTLNTAPQKPSR